MHGAGITLIVGVILVGCAPEASSPTVATIAATPTEQPAATKVAWPAEWGDDVCAVLATFSLAAALLLLVPNVFLLTSSLETIRTPNASPLASSAWCGCRSASRTPPG